MVMQVLAPITTKSGDKMLDFVVEQQCFYQLIVSEELLKIISL